MIKKVQNKILIEIEVNQMPEGWFCGAEKLGAMKTDTGRVEILTGVESKSLLFEMPDKTRWFIENRDVCRRAIMAILNQEVQEDET